MPDFSFRFLTQTVSVAAVVLCRLSWLLLCLVVVVRRPGVLRFLLL